MFAWVVTSLATWTKKEWPLYVIMGVALSPQIAKAWVHVASSRIMQERKKQLFSVIDDNLKDHPDESDQLKEIIEDWANLKIEAFQNRRSWVRATPDK